MIRSYFGLDRNPFDTQNIQLLAHQQEIFDILRIHSQQGGMCLVLGEPGSGKSVIKNALQAYDPKRLIAPAVSRTLHTYLNTLRILSQAFKVDFDGSDFKCEKRLIEEAFRLNQHGKMLVPIIDDAHLMNIRCLRKLRLLLEDFPKNHNLVLFGEPDLLRTIQNAANEDIRSRITYSVTIAKLGPEETEAFILEQLDRAGLGHNTFTEEALALIIRSAEGVLRRVRNLCVSALIEAVRGQTKRVDLPQVNRVLIQPHWRKHHDVE